MADLVLRDLHLVKKALAIAILTIERQAGPLQSRSDQADMKGLMERLIVSDSELAHYTRAAKIAVTGAPDSSPALRSSRQAALPTSLAAC